MKPTVITRLSKVHTVLLTAKRLRAVYSNLLVLAEASSAKYLVGLNLKQLTKAPKPADVDPRQYYQGLQEEAGKGPLFSADIIRKVESLQVPLQKLEIKWLADQLVKKPSLDLSKLQFVMDWSRAHNNSLPDYNQAIRSSNQWHKELESNTSADNRQKYKTHDVVHKYSNGWEMVKVSSVDAKLEGELMSHCVGSYCKQIKSGESDIFSLRDPEDLPHVTIELQDDKVIQIFGKKNVTPISKKYIPYVTEWLVLNDLWNGEALAYAPLKILTELSRSKDDKAKLSVAKSPLITTEIAEALVQDNNHVILRELARNIHIPTSILVQFSASDDTYVREDAFGNKSMPPDILSKTAEEASPYDTVQAIIAKNPSTPLWLLAKLAKSSMHSIREGVARNPGTPVELLLQLAEDPVDKVRRGIAANTNTPVELLWKLADDPEEYVVSEVAENPKTPVDLLLELAEHDDELIADSAIHNQNFPEEEMDKYFN